MFGTLVYTTLPGLQLFDVIKSPSIPQNLRGINLLHKKVLTLLIKLFFKNWSKNKNVAFFGISIHNNVCQMMYLVITFTKPPLKVNNIVLQDYAQCRFDAYFKQKKLFS